MGLLPNSRNTNYGANSPVKSADLNDIQDCIVSHKHAEEEHVILAPGWLPDGFSIGAGTYNGAIWISPAAGLTLRAALPFLRPGERITQCKFTYGRQNAGNVVYELIEVDYATATSTTIATATDNASGMGDVTKLLAAINHAVAAGKGYVLHVSFDAAAGAAGAYLRCGAAFADCL